MATKQGEYNSRSIISNNNDSKFKKQLQNIYNNSNNETAN